MAGLSHLLLGLCYLPIVDREVVTGGLVPTGEQLDGGAAEMPDDSVKVASRQG